MQLESLDTTTRTLFDARLLPADFTNSSLSYVQRLQIFARQSRANAAITAWRARRGTYLLLKRIVDLTASVLMLLALTPFFLIVAAAIRIDSPGNIFFSQIRIGRNGQRFRMYKLRTMSVNAEARKKELQHGFENGGVRFKMKHDPRITRVGRCLRRMSIDELPQIWNVLRGDMTLVGPRPSVPGEVSLYSALDRQRLQVTPGLTCLWQVNGRSEIDFAGQVALDVEYIQKRCLLLDFVLLLKTVPAVLSGRGAC